MQANRSAATSEGGGTATVACAQAYPSRAAGSMLATPSEQQGPSQDVLTSSPSLPAPIDSSFQNANAAGKSVGGGGEAPLPPGIKRNWNCSRQNPRATYVLHCPAHGPSKVHNCQDLQKRMTKHAACRPEWAELLQREGESWSTFRDRMLGLGLHFNGSLVPKEGELQCQAAAAKCGAQRPGLTGSPTAAAAAEAAGAAAAALTVVLTETLAQEGNLPEPPTAISNGCFAKLLKDFQRTTEQLVRDKLQDQRAVLDQQTQQRIALLQRENERLRQGPAGQLQQALPQQQQQSLVSCQAPAEEQQRRIEGLEHEVERLRQDYERLKEECRLQQQRYVQERAAAEEQRTRMEAFGERLGHVAERLYTGPDAQQQRSAAQCQAPAEQQGRNSAPLPRAHLLMAPKSGASAPAQPTLSMSSLPGTLPPSPVPARTISQPHSLPPEGQAAGEMQDISAEEPLHSQQQCQVPFRMDQVLLEWDGGDSVVLTRFQDTEGSWFCYREMYRKLEASMPVEAGQSSTCRRVGPGYRPATREELGFLKASGTLGSTTAHAVLISVDKAVRVCAEAEVAAPLLAAISGIAELQPYSAPLPRAHLLMTPQSGAPAPAQRTNSLPSLPGTLPPSPVPARIISQPHSPPRGRQAAGEMQGILAEEPLHSQQQCQVPITMDQVLLEWDGENTVVLARIQDVEGSWLCHREVQSKLEASMPVPSMLVQAGQALQTLLKCRRDGPGYRPATLKEVRFLKTVRAISLKATHSMLISVYKAVRTYSRAGVAAPLLAAIAGIAELQPYSAPVPRAHPHMAPQSGASAPAQPANSLPSLQGTLPPSPVPARTLSQPHSLPHELLEAQPLAAQLQQAQQQDQSAAQPITLNMDTLNARPGAPAAWQAADGGDPQAQQQRQQQVASHTVSQVGHPTTGAAAAIIARKQGLLLLSAPAKAAQAPALAALPGWVHVIAETGTTAAACSQSGQLQVVPQSLGPLVPARKPRSTMDGAPVCKAAAEPHMRQQCLARPVCPDENVAELGTATGSAMKDQLEGEQQRAARPQHLLNSAASAAAAVILTNQERVLRQLASPGGAAEALPVRSAQQSDDGFSARSGSAATSMALKGPQRQQWQAAPVDSSTNATFGTTAADDSDAAERLQVQQQVQGGAKRPAQEGVSAPAASTPMQEQVPSFPCSAASEQLIARCLNRMQRAQRAASLAQDSQPAKQDAAAAAIGTKRKRKLEAKPCRALGVACLNTAAPDQAAAAAQAAVLCPGANARGCSES